MKKLLLFTALVFATTLSFSISAMEQGSEDTQKDTPKKPRHIILTESIGSNRDDLNVHVNYLKGIDFNNEEQIKQIKKIMQQKLQEKAQKLEKKDKEKADSLRRASLNLDNFEYVEIFQGNLVHPTHLSTEYAALKSYQKEKACHLDPNAKHFFKAYIAALTQTVGKNGTLVGKPKKKKSPREAFNKIKDNYRHKATK